MRHAHPSRLLVVSLLAASWAFADAGWSEYRDPQGLFSLSHPTGWAVKPMLQANTIAVTQSDLCYVAMGAEANMRQMNASQLAQQLIAGIPIGIQSGGVRQVSTRPDVACVDYLFSSPQGQAVQGKLMACADASMCYAIFYVAPQAQFEQALPVFCRVVASFRHVQVTLPGALYGAQEQAVPVPQPSPAPRPMPQPCPAPRPAPMPQPVPAPTPAPRPSNDGGNEEGPSVRVPSEWTVTWKSKGTFQAGDREKAATEGAMVSSIEVEGSYEGPTPTLKGVLTHMHGYKNVEVQSLAVDERTAKSLLEGVRNAEKVEVEAVLAKFRTPDGVECLGVGYAVNVVLAGERGKYSCLFALYFASKDRFDALLPTFRETAKSILAWKSPNDLSEELGQGSLMVLDAVGDARATPDRATPQPSPRPRRSGSGLVEKLGPAVRSR